MQSALLCYGARCYPVRPSVCPSHRSHRWISQKRLKLGLCNCHATIAPSLQFHPEI